MCYNNSFSGELESMDLEKCSESEKAVCILVWLIIEVLGNGFIIGIIQFDRLGGDPLKRRITDQVSEKVFKIINCTLINQEFR